MGFRVFPPPADSFARGAGASCRRPDLGGRLAVMAADDVEALATALRDAIAKQGDRVKDVFKALDKDGDGSVSQKEFSDGILGLGLPLAKEQFTHIDGALSPAHPPPIVRTATRACCGRAMCPATHHQ